MARNVFFFSCFSFFFSCAHFDIGRLWITKWTWKIVKSFSFSRFSKSQGGWKTWEISNFYQFFKISTADWRSHNFTKNDEISINSKHLSEKVPHPSPSPDANGLEDKPERKRSFFHSPFWHAFNNRLRPLPVFSPPFTYRPHRDESLASRQNNRHTRHWWQMRKECEWWLWCW